MAFAEKKKVEESAEEGEEVGAVAVDDRRHSCYMTALRLDWRVRAPLEKRPVPKSINWAKTHAPNGKLMDVLMVLVKADDWVAPEENGGPVR